MGLTGISTPWVLLVWLSIPLAIRQMRFVFTETGRVLNQALAGTARLELIYGLLFSVGLAIQFWYL
jgi:1,4-dihydroxy-2-naphthoate octaprenyltransferase